MGGFASRIARGLVSLMEARDADGYVFRTDLRLRPDPAVTPPAVALPAAITYYESMGQNWERAAMIKARPVAGDLGAGRRVPRGDPSVRLAPRPRFRRGRRHPRDEAADRPAQGRRAGRWRRPGGAHRRPQREARRRRHPRDRVPGADAATRLGRPRSRPARSDHTGRAALLVRAGHVPRDAARELGAAYRFLRRVEHRLQMVADRQVHDLPQRPDGSGAVRHVHGLSPTRPVRRRTAAPSAPGAGALRRGVRVGAGTAGTRRTRAGVGLQRRRTAPEATGAALRCAWLRQPDRIVAAVRGWQAGHVRALRSARARELLAQMLPRILAALARQPQPDVAFNRFDAFLARQPAGVQLLSLFQRNPGLLDRIAAVLGAAPSLADHLASHPAALDGLLSPEENPQPRPSAARPPAGRAPAGGSHRDHPPYRARGGFLHLGRHDGGQDRRR